MIRRSLPAAAVLLVLACGRGEVDVSGASDGSQLPPPAAALSGSEPGGGVQDRLESIDADLGEVLEGGLDDESHAFLFRAEATTDRLLEDEPDQAWLAAGYSVEARLRQIQALADRIVSELRRGVARELVLEDVAALRVSVQDLRTQLGQPGNGPAPPSLDSLLVAYENDPYIPFGRAAGGGGGAAAAADTGSTPTTEATPEPEASPDGLLGEPIQP